jgi:flagellar basal-body rod modification protein FlgD
MQVSSTNSVSAPGSFATASQAVSKAKTVDYDQFLQLLVAEMKNQDPTNPMDPTQTVSQLASFSAVEQALRTNDMLSTLLSQSTLSQAGSLIGKTITTADGSTSGQIVSITTSASGLTATLADGRIVQLQPGISIR